MPGRVGRGGMDFDGARAVPGGGREGWHGFCGGGARWGGGFTTCWGVCQVLGLPYHTKSPLSTASFRLDIPTEVCMAAQALDKQPKVW